MFGFSSKLPVGDDDRQWVEDGFKRLERMLGRRRMLDAEVVLPTAECFPDPYSKDLSSAEALFQRVCSYMRVDRRAVELEVFADESDELRKLVPYWRGNSGGCAGLFTHDQSADGDKRIENMVVAVRKSQLGDPLALVATLAHELGHVILLGGKLMDPKTADHEPMTDLLTVYLGVGVFSANSAARFKQYQDDGYAGWSMQHLGYLPEEVYGYALAKFAVERGEEKPAWVKHLSTNVRSYYSRSRAWMAKNGPLIPTPKPIG